jgi:hypothetical protein
LGAMPARSTAKAAIAGKARSYDAPRQLVGAPLGRDARAPARAGIVGKVRSREAVPGRAAIIPPFPYRPRRTQT